MTRELTGIPFGELFNQAVYLGLHGPGLGLPSFMLSSQVVEIFIVVVVVAVVEVIVAMVRREWL
jgi:hypothetical protein